MTTFRGLCLVSWIVFLVFVFGGCNEDDKGVEPGKPSLTWEVTGLSDGDVLSLAVDNIGIVYASVDEDGIYRSTDSGQTWSKPKSGPFTGSAGSGYAQCLVTHGYTLWAGTNGVGIYQSTDEGSSWIETPEGNVSIGRIYSMCAAGERMFCGAENGIFLLENDGQWTQVETHRAYAVCEGSDGGGVYAGSEYGPWGPGAILCETNEGPWYITAVGNGRVMCLARASDGTMFAGGYGIGVLRHAAYSSWWVWEAVLEEGSEPGMIIEKIVTVPSGGLFVSNGAHIYGSLDNGDSWAWVSHHLSGGHVYALAVNAAGYVFAGTEGGVFRARL